MKITCLIAALDTGGAQKVIAQLAGGLARHGHEVTLMTYTPSIPDFYATPTGVKRVTLPLEPGPHRWFNPLRQIRRLLTLRSGLRSESPDVIISFIDTTNILSLVISPSGTPPVIACERVNPEYNGIGPHWRLLRRILYPRAAKVVMQTEDTRRWALSLWPRWDAVAIPNPVLPPVFIEAAPRPAFLSKPLNLMAMGRLDRQKGFDILLSAFAGLAAKFPEWQLIILGEGPARAALEKMVRDLGLEGRVLLQGAVDKPSEVLKYADLFVLSSRYEGFPNALTEAMACGVPAVSFDCPSGPSEIIRNGIDGLLVPAENRKGLASALDTLMSDGDRRARMGQRASEVIQRFDMEKYLDTWEGLIRNAAGSHAEPRC
jgi:glycosyltransferase involved in cell wall biosynthesis